MKKQEKKQHIKRQQLCQNQLLLFKQSMTLHHPHQQKMYLCHASSTVLAGSRRCYHMWLALTKKRGAKGSIWAFWTENNLQGALT